MSFPHSNDFIESHKLGYIVALFSLNSKMSLISFFIPSLMSSITEKTFVHFQRECWLSIIYVVIEDQSALVLGGLIACF